MILIIDDDPSVTASVGLLLKQHGHPTASAHSPAEAAVFATDPSLRLVLCDMNFSRDTSGREGLELLAVLRRERPEVPVILITAWGSIALAVEGIKAGAADFVTKPWNNVQLMQSIETALSISRSGRDEAPEPAAPSRGELEARHDLRGIVGDDPAFLRTLALAGRVSPTEASVLITGASGTGKEVIAEAIHRNSRRADRPFVKVNLGGISSTLFESEMFGHVRGAFTDASRDRKGRFEVADGGTIFLDEIGELDASSQVKLLRVLQDRTYEMLGSSVTRTVNVRVISATNRDLADAVAAGQFREDLLYRLNLITIRLPSLVDRPGDLLPLARYFLAHYAGVYGRGPMSLDRSAAAWIESHTWPGNVRQLKQTIERTVLVLDRGRVAATDLDLLADLDARDERGPSLPRPGAMTLDQIEKAMIVKCLDHYGGNVTRVAEALGLSRAALYRRFQKYGVDPTTPSTS